MLAYLAAVVNEDDDVAIRRVINTPKRGIGDAAVEADRAAALETWWQAAFAASPELSSAPRSTRPRALPRDPSARRDRVFVALMDDLRSLARGQRPGRRARRDRRPLGLLTALRASDDPQDASRIENIMELVAVGREFTEENPEGTLADFLEKVALVADADQVPDRRRLGRRGDPDDAAHRQGPRVPGRVRHGARGRHVPAHALDRVRRHKDMEEERRLAYVGLTRARERLYLTRAEVRSRWGAPQYFPRRVSPRRSRPTSWSGGGPRRPWRRCGHAPSGVAPAAGRARTGRATEAARTARTATPTRRRARSARRRVPPSPPGDQPEAMLGLEVGDRVTHDSSAWARWWARGRGQDAVAKVDFGAAGVKRLALRFNALTKL